MLVPGALYQALENGLVVLPGVYEEMRQRDPHEGTGPKMDRAISNKGQCHCSTVIKLWSLGRWQRAQPSKSHSAADRGRKL